MTNIQKHAIEATKYENEKEHVKVYFLLACDTGKVLFKGTLSECLKHLLNSPMAIVLTAKNAFEYQQSISAEGSV